MIDSAAMIANTKQIAMDLDALRRTNKESPLAVGIFVIFCGSSLFLGCPAKQTSKTPARRRKNLANTKESSSQKSAYKRSIASKAASKQRV